MSKTFMKITNQDIYEKIEELIIQQKETNGKVKVNRWIATTALSLAFVLIGLQTL